MITELGTNLSVLILTEPEMDWQTFATWYSIYKNLPYAKVAICCIRNGKMPFVYYQWTKRLNIPTIRCNQFAEGSEVLNLLSSVQISEEDLLKDAILIMKPLTMAIDTLESKVLNRMNTEDLMVDDHLWFMRNQDTGKLINDYFIEDWKPQKGESFCVEAKENKEPACLISYKKGCGRWINKAKGCPFSSAGGLFADEMTMNEYRVIELWKKMVSLYNAVA